LHHFLICFLAYFSEAAFAQACDAIPECQDLDDECNASLCSEGLLQPFCSYVHKTLGFMFVGLEYHKPVLNDGDLYVALRYAHEVSVECSILLQNVSRGNITILYLQPSAMRFALKHKQLHKGV